MVDNSDESDTGIFGEDASLGLEFEAEATAAHTTAANAQVDAVLRAAQVTQNPIQNPMQTTPFSRTPFASNPLPGRRRSFFQRPLPNPPPFEATPRIANISNPYTPHPNPLRPNPNPIP